MILKKLLIEEQIIYYSNFLFLGAIANFLSVLQQQQAKTSSSNTVPTTMHSSIAQSIQEQDLLQQQQRDLASSNLSKLEGQPGEVHEGNTDQASRSPSFTRYSSPSPNNIAVTSSFLANATMTATNANMLQGKKSSA